MIPRHTPGPWRLERTAEGEFDGAVLAERGDNNGTFRVCLFKYMGHSETAEANARLISAAPELFEAAKRVSDYLDSLIMRTRTPEVELVLRKLRGDLEEALLKASGTAS